MLPGWEKHLGEERDENQSSSHDLDPASLKSGEEDSSRSHARRKLSMGDLDTLGQIIVGSLVMVGFVIYTVLPVIERRRREAKEFLPDRDGKVIAREKLGKNAQFLLTRFERMEDSRERCNELYKTLLYMHESAGGRTDGLERDWRLAFVGAFVIAGVAIYGEYRWLAIFLLVLGGIALARPLWSDRFSKWYSR